MYIILILKFKELINLYAFQQKINWMVKINNNLLSEKSKGNVDAGCRMEFRLQKKLNRKIFFFITFILINYK